MRRIPRVALAAAACVAVMSFGAQATAAEKVVICHGTASETEPYALIEVEVHALAGHFDGTEPGHGDNNHPDFFPPAGGDCSGGPGGGEF
jgi:hypothetical protein